MDNQSILNGLNDDQKKPVLDFEGPSFILAGPGARQNKDNYFKNSLYD